MTAHNHARGTCLCGAVTLSVARPATSVGACHCRMCRKWGGGPLLAVECGTAVTIAGEDSVTVFDSSPWAQRGFCKHCGTHLFYRLKEAQQYHLPAGLFDEAPGFSFDQQIFVDEQPAYYRFANDTRNLTGAEVFALYAPPAD
ncbi:GFA family protein [Denitromonas sp.]|uniref:GFA family protein n=1 Tax=Denitromonas sp. TaxID=2734609 RepID=UPI003A8A9523